MRPFHLLVLALTPLAAATPAAAQETPPPGYSVAGQPTGCVLRQRVRSIRPVDAETLYFRMTASGPDYINKTRGACEYKPKVEALVSTTPQGSRFCSGDALNRTVLTENNLFRGTCVLGDFTPVKRETHAHP